MQKYVMRLRPPPYQQHNKAPSRRDHSCTSTFDHDILQQQRRSSSRLHLKSSGKESRHVIANNNLSARTSSSSHRSKQRNRQPNDSTIGQHRRRQRRSNQTIQSSNHLLPQDIHSLESSNNNRQRRKRKGSSYNANNAQPLCITLIRLVIVSSLAYFIITHAYSIIHNILASLHGSFHYSRRRKSAHLDNAFVQNVQEIQDVLELAETEFDMLQNDQSQLHSVRGEEKIGYFEQIAHPGDKSVKLSVPKFYASVSIGENGRVGIGGEQTFRQVTRGKLLIAELARMIGNDTEETHSIPLPERTIFVSIISKSDSQCSTTITNLLKSAANPGRIRVAVVDRTNPLSRDYTACDAPTVPCSNDPDQMLCVYAANVDVYEMKDELDAGAIFARHIGHRMYRGEYYALQIGVDTSIIFSERWDEELIRQLEVTRNEMAVISTYLSDTKIPNDNGLIEATPERYTMCHATYRGDGRERRLEHIRSEQVHQTAPPDRAETPLLQPFWSSEFSFSRGHFVMQVPYDPKICGLDEQDEEISMALRAFSSGYDFYTLTQSVIFRTKPDSNKHVGGVSCNLNAKVKSRKRLYSLVGLNDNDEDAIPYEYGLGAVREISKFFTLYGIHASERITEHRLCEFVVTGNMHDEFSPHLRQDGMGIDYNRVSFRFHELISIHKDSHQ